MIEQARDILRVARKANVDFIDKYTDLIQILAAAAIDPVSSGLSDEELVDVIRVLRDCDDIFDRLRREAKKVCKELEDGLVRRSAAKSVNDDDSSGMVVSTKYARAVADVRAVLPVFKKSKDPENYERVMRWLGIPEHLIEAGAVEMHWEGMKAILEQKLREAGPDSLPPGLDPNKVYYQGSLRLWRRADPLTDEPQQETES